VLHTILDELIGDDSGFRDGSRSSSSVTLTSSDASALRCRRGVEPSLFTVRGDDGAAGFDSAAHARGDDAAQHDAAQHDTAQLDNPTSDGTSPSVAVAPSDADTTNTFGCPLAAGFTIDALRIGRDE
jgi:hypothetical protein